MPKRLIGTSLILIFIGMLPFILSFFKVQLQWPTQLPEFIPMLIRQWLVDYGSFDLIWIVGVCLLVLAAILAVRILWKEQFTTEPISTTDVLLQEVEAIHGMKPGDDLEKDIK